MTEGPGAEDAPTTTTDTELDALLRDPASRAWFEEHLPELRQDASGQRILLQMLAGIFIVGLVAYVAGYLIRASATTEPLGLLADLLYTFGFALWTAAVVVVLVEIVPEAKRRQIKRALDAYEAAGRDKPRTRRLRRRRSG
jgi:F0F1-type ATP synthase assembly protein I